ncbi:MAG: sugar phosphate isomerase/epimerase [Campylobacteraceae bacterium]|nr:sugar phosphate isomerase/epimerase [Campylobacteraceae bacterium]
MSRIEKYFAEVLSHKIDGAIGIKLPPFTKEVAKKLKNRIENIELYLHSYTFYKNFFYGKLTINEFLDFAYTHGFKGIAINIRTGKQRSFNSKTDDEIKEIAKYAKFLNLSINIDISSANKEDFEKALHVANLVNAKTIRFYIRESGLVSKITREIIPVLKEMAKLAKKSDINLLMEQHEDLKSYELVEIVKKVNAKNLNLMFDYGNMINAYEKPLVALEIMAPFVKQVHIKGVKTLKEEKGFGHLGVREGDDDLPHAKLIFDLLMLGDKEPQVEIFYLEEVNDYCAPAYRFKDEGDDAFIPQRSISITKKDENICLEEVLRDERRDAFSQIVFIQSLLCELKTLANVII